MKTIIIDIDDTVADSTNYLMKYAIEFDKYYARGEGIIDSSKDLTRCFNWPKDILKLFLEKVFDKYLDEIPSIKDSVDIINKLKQAGHKIIFVSSRNEEQMKEPYKRTLNWLKQNNFQFDKLIVKERYKGPVKEKEKADIFIDDSIGQTTYVSDNYKVEVILFSKIKENYNNIKIIDNWNEIYKTIN